MLRLDFKPWALKNEVVIYHIYYVFWGDRVDRVTGWPLSYVINKDDNVIHGQLDNTVKSIASKHHTKCDFSGHGISITRSISYLIFSSIYILTITNSVTCLKYSETDYLLILRKIRSNRATDIFLGLIKYLVWYIKHSDNLRLYS